MRRRLSGALVVIASVFLVAATLALYAHATLSDPGRFADRATAGIQDESVRTLIADRVTDQLILRHQADLVTARPIISSAVAGLVGSRPFGSLFRRSVLDAHRAVFARDQNTLTLTVADAGVVTAAALSKLKPDLAATLEKSGSVQLLSRHVGAGDDVVRHAARLRAGAYLLAALTLVAALAALALSVDRRRTAGRLGVGIAAAGVAIVVAYTVARGAITGRVSGADERAAAQAVWDAYLKDLRSIGWVLAVSGAVLAAAAASLVRPAGPEGALRAAWRWAATEPARSWPRALRAGALVVAGAFVLLQPSSALQVAATLVGVFLLYSGVASFLRLVNAPSTAAAEPPRRRPRARLLAVPVVAVVLIVAADAAFVTAGGASAPAASVGACDGSATLCDRPLDDVVLAATHNSMAAPPGWFSSQQDRGIAGQLQEGIRGLLIDTYYADKLANGRVRTSIPSAAKLRASLQADGISDTSYRAAVRLRERLGFRGRGRRGIYLCHRFCELGATPLPEALNEIHDFLVNHPSEVIVVVNQDSVTPEDFVKAVDDAGLARYAFTPPSSGSWPTLRTMIEEDRRLLFLAENNAGAAPWYQLAYHRLLEETPFTFRNAAGLADHRVSCAANRGPSAAPLFLINNWVNTDPAPRPSIAARVNAYGPLLARARACRKMRGHLPNLLAVDFYKRGDLFRVVDTLNGT